MALRHLPDKMPGAGPHNPGDQGDRFPGYDVLHEVPTWDPVTAGVVLRRLGPPPPLRYFDLAEEAAARALLDQLLDQRDEPRVPVLEMIDSRLAEQETDGWHYDDMPEDGPAWRRSLRALDSHANDLFGCDFASLGWEQQTQVIEAVHDRGDRDWYGLPAARVWSLWTRYAGTAFYSHPYAWNEIGFGGPAYPRGYENLGLDRREPWEVADAHPDRDPIKLIQPTEDTRRRQAAELDTREGGTGAEAGAGRAPGGGNGAGAGRGTPAERGAGAVHD